MFLENNVDTTCTSTLYSNYGLTACIVDLAFQLFENEKTSVYIGSWAEFVRDSSDLFMNLVLVRMARKAENRRLGHSM